MAKRLVEWCKKSFHRIPLPEIHTNIDLKPGVNEVEEAHFEKAMENELVRWYVDEGYIKLRGSSVTSLSKVKPIDALELVKNTVDRQLLERWASTERRERVQQAIAAQLVAITPKGAKKEEESSEEASESGAPEVEA